jgi:DNA-binding MarR family transcriptional regulator
MTRIDCLDENNIILLMRISSLGLLRNTTAQMSKHGISANVWYFLRILWETDGLSQKELALGAGVLQPNAVATIRHMAETGLVLIERETQDRRRTRAWLTPKSRQLEQELLPKFNSEAYKLFSGCLSDDELQTLCLILRKLSSHVNSLQ